MNVNTEIIGPEWAYGCDDCSYGIVLPPPVRKGSVSIFDSRQAQARRGELTFCECQAGQATQRHLLGEQKPVENVPTFQKIVPSGRQIAPPTFSAMPAMAHESWDNEPEF